MSDFWGNSLRKPSSFAVLVLGVCTDPEMRDYLALHTAFALSTTQLVPEGNRPAPAAGQIPAESNV
ncbi:hypothetical protein [Microbacterium esteraromaticum]|uniref:hypothetical protein n=1 Tax=Microbacterium esteraromaticum TaxID=57043 RepID=UPI001C978F51|nr:hypothetical protein [Microbacterium esteraromaticum]MBY6061591.1 hypothetical protein [Microbacterium esteraromaticum]